MTPITAMFCIACAIVLLAACGYCGYAIFKARRKLSEVSEKLSEEQKRSAFRYRLLTEMSAEAEKLASKNRELEASLAEIYRAIDVQNENLATCEEALQAAVRRAQEADARAEEIQMRANKWCQAAQETERQFNQLRLGMWDVIKGPDLQVSLDKGREEQRHRLVRDYLPRMGMPKLTPAPGS